MRAMSIDGGGGATNGASTNESGSFGGPNSGSAKTSTPKSESEESAWFWRPVRNLLPTDAGAVLSKLTDVPDSTCYRYARGQSPPTTYFYRKLLWLPEGETWLRVLLDGNEQPWWTEMRTSSARLAKVVRSLSE